MNIHDINKDDDVRGVVVGGMSCVGRLTYDGRNQRGVVYAGDIDELREKALSLKCEISDDMGASFDLIFPNDTWRLIIIQ